MPWLGPWPDAPDTYKMWADSGSMRERAIRASGYKVVQAAPGSSELDSTVLPTDPLDEGETEDEVIP